jgi:hypothetical protein
MLFAALPVVSCTHPEPEQDPIELSVSIYIPDILATKAETGSVGALDGEKVISSLQLWVFLSGGTNDGQLVGYKGFTDAQLVDTGLPHSATTRFGLPLTREMFNTLHADGTRVDVYAVANAASATTASLGEGTTRSELDAIVISGPIFGVSPLTMAVPATGLPMSGVLKAAPVSGSYPVLNISTLTLTRAVSKIRFVFCQQGIPASGSNQAVPDKPACVVKSITFGGTSEGHDCQIATTEKLFTAKKYGTTDNPFDIDGYTPLAATLAGEGSNPLLENADITVSAHPDTLLFRSRGHEMETAREYESRLDAAVSASSQIGPIYIRETDKLISGTIVYNVGEEDDRSVTFSMPEGNVLSRNHSWILYAYFAETTRTLQLKIVVLPWDKSTYNMDFVTTTSNIVNVVRRFTITETDPSTFTKNQNVNGYFDIYFWHTLDGQPNVIKGDIIIDAPVGQKLHIVPVSGARNGSPIDNIFSITPMEATIYPKYGDPENARSEDCKIEFEIQCTPGSHTPAELEGQYIDIHFCVQIGSGDNSRWVDLDSESRDFYRIYLKQNWEDWENW